MKDYLHLLYIYAQNIEYYLNTYSLAFKTFFENICLVLSVGLQAQNEWCLQADTQKICEWEMFLKCESGSSVEQIYQSSSTQSHPKHLSSVCLYSENIQFDMRVKSVANNIMTHALCHQKA